jgi:hypothetical protein
VVGPGEGSALIGTRDCRCSRVVVGPGEWGVSEKSRGMHCR